MFQLFHKIFAAILAFLGFLFGAAPVAKAQGVTYQQAITWAGSTSPNHNAPSDTIRDVNQTGAWAYTCSNDPDGIAITATFELEGSYDKINWFQIGSQGSIGAGVQCASILASGYFPFTRLNLLVYIGDGTHYLFANYSASFTPLTQQGAQRLGQQAQKFLPEALTSNWASASVLSTPLAISQTAMGVVSISVYNPNSTVVYAALSNNTSWPVVSQIPSIGWAAAIAPNSSQSFSFPVPLALTNPAPAISPHIYAMCSALFGALANPASACTISVSGYNLQMVNTLVNAAGAVQSQALDLTGW